MAQDDEFFIDGRTSKRSGSQGSPKTRTSKGSAVAGTDESGDILWTETYTPFGISLVNDASNDNQAGFTGHLKDTDTGLTYMQARYYDPVIGRFLSHDPEGFMSQDLNPMYFNRYMYTMNNPINALDPDGEQTVTDQERLFVEHGDLDAFWQSRTDRGDPVGQLGLEFGKGYTDMNSDARAASKILASAIYEKHAGGMNAISTNEETQESMQATLINYRIGLAEAHIQEVDADTEGNPNFLSASQITDYHHDVLKDNGLATWGFGATPVFGATWEAHLTNNLVGWCNSCDED